MTAHQIVKKTIHTEAFFNKKNILFSKNMIVRFFWVLVKIVANESHEHEIDEHEGHEHVRRVVRDLWVEEQLHEDLFKNYNKDVRPIDLASIVTDFVE